MEADGWTTPQLSAPSSAAGGDRHSRLQSATASFEDVVSDPTPALSKAVSMHSLAPTVEEHATADHTEPAVAEPTAAETTHGADAITVGAAQIPPRTSSSGVETLNRAVRREIVEAKLTQFYRDYCPSKVHHVREIYDASEARIELLFTELLAKYSKAPRNSFDDVKALLRARLPPVVVASPARAPSVPSTMSSFYLTPMAAQVDPQSGPTPAGSFFRLPDVPHSDASSPPAAAPLRPRPVAANAHLDNTPASVAALLAQGQELLNASPPPGAATPAARSATPSSVAAPAAADAAERDEAGYRRQVKELESLVERNLALAQQVAEAELAVFHERLRVQLEATLDDPRLSQRCEPGDRLTITHSQRRFSVPLSDALWRYVLEGPLRAPLPAPKFGPGLVCSVGVVGLRAAGAFKPLDVDVNVMAAAMREWSRQLPHTVTEDDAVSGAPTGSSLVDITGRPRVPAPSPGRTRYHASSELWWAWPAPVQRRRGIDPVSLFASGGNVPDAAFEGALEVQLHNDPAALAVLDTLGLAAGSRSGSVADLPGFRLHFANQWDALTRTLGSAEAAALRGH
jgi:hypothetical protein